MSSATLRRLQAPALLAVSLAAPTFVLGIWMIKLYPYHPGVLAFAGSLIAAPGGMVLENLRGIPSGAIWAIAMLVQVFAIFVPLAAYRMVRRESAEAPATGKSVMARIVMLFLNALAFIPLAGYLREFSAPLAEPTRLVSSDFKTAKAGLPKGIVTDFDELAFARGKLYVASAIGLIEVESKRVSAIYQWHRNSRIDDVWSGPGGRSLWVRHQHSGALSELSDAGWKNVSLPTPSRGYTRGDFMSGFKAAASDEGFWLAGASTVWKWRPASRDWQVVALPPMDEFANVGVYSAGKSPLVLEGSSGFFNSCGHKIHSTATDGSWNTELLDPFCADKLAVADKAIYFPGNNGELLVHKNGETTTIAAPGRIDAMIATHAGDLIASIEERGVFVYNGAWRKLFDSPYPQNLGKKFSHIAADGSSIALSITRYPENDAQQRFSGLWVWDGSTVVQVTVPD